MTWQRNVGNGTFAACAPSLVLEAIHEEVRRHLSHEELEGHAAPSSSSLGAPDHRRP